MAIVIDLGNEVSYNEAYSLQKNLLSMRQQNKLENTFLLLEHKKVFTLGFTADSNNILLPQDVLKENGYDVYKTDRGGDVTYHGPGQLVGYFIFYLKDYKLSIKNFFNNIEEVFILLLEKYYGIKAERIPKMAGVWIDNSKITAIGCAVKHGVTMHGFGFNINTNLDDFKYIVPCGITDKKVTSLEKLTNQTQDINIVKQQVISCVNQVFHIELKNKSIEQLNREVSLWKKENQIG